MPVAYRPNGSCPRGRRCSRRGLTSLAIGGIDLVELLEQRVDAIEHAADAPAALAGSGYLSHWAGATRLGAAQAQQPVTHVSWFAAQAFCEARGARLPTWNEWEYTAAADETHRDARKDPAWRERILGWYSRPATGPLPRAGLQTPNAYGVQDLHGLIWEWTDDFSSLLVSGDNRVQGDADKTKFCGAGALSMDDRENYAVLMRVAMLSSLEASDTTTNLGFRCAKNIAAEQPAAGWEAWSRRICATAGCWPMRSAPPPCSSGS